MIGRGWTQSHRTLSFIKSASSLPLILLSLAISIAAAAASAPFWDITVVSGTTFWLVSDDKVWRTRRLFRHGQLPPVFVSLH